MLFSLLSDNYIGIAHPGGAKNPLVVHIIQITFICSAWKSFPFVFRHSRSLLIGARHNLWPIYKQMSNLYNHLSWRIICQLAMSRNVRDISVQTGQNMLTRFSMACPLRVLLTNFCWSTDAKAQIDRLESFLSVPFLWNYLPFES